MGSKWEKVKLSDAATVTNGKSDVKDALDYGKYVFFDRSVLRKYSNKFLFDTEAIIIPGEDSRQIFEPRYFEGKFDLHQRCYAVFDFKANFLAKYFYYKLKTLTAHFANVCVGSTVPSLRLANITDLVIKVPDLPTQRAIARVLSQLDEKIELNRKINAELETLASTIFIFNFVQNADPNWKRVLIGDIAEVIRGTTITEKQAQAGNVKVVAGGLDFAYFHNKHNREKYTITVSGSGNAGFVNFWHERIFASDCTTVRGKTDFDTFIIYEFLKWQQEAIYIKAKGAVQQHVYPSDIKSISFYDIPKDIKDKFAPTYTAIHEQTAKNINENYELAALRDYLLPLLMNGQVTVEGIA